MISLGQKAYEIYAAYCLEKHSCAMDPWNELSDMDKEAWDHTMDLMTES